MICYSDNKKPKHSQEDGVIVVEAVITLTIFLIIVALITYLMTIFTVHNRIQFAMNSAAHEISTYSYLYQVTGLRKADQTFTADGSTNVGNINSTTAKVLDTVGKIEELAGVVAETSNTFDNPEISGNYINTTYNQINRLENSVNSTVESTEQSIDAVQNLLSDPKGLAAGLIYIVLEEGESALKGMIGAGIAKSMTEDYLSTPTMTADEYCLSHGIVGGYDGLDFTGSSLFNDGVQGYDPNGVRVDGDFRMIDFVVTYKIDLGFAKIVFPPDEAYLQVVQRVTVPAWTNGDGREPEDYGVTIMGRGSSDE